LILLDHLIRPQQERRRDRQAEHLGGLEVDDQLELRRVWASDATPAMSSRFRRLPVRATDAAVASLASSIHPEASDKCREVREVTSRDLRAGRQMLQAVRGRCPRRVTPENLSDPGFLGRREHDQDIVAEQYQVGQRPGSVINAGRAPAGTAPKRGEATCWAGASVS
jgi:hypothetical protein